MSNPYAFVLAMLLKKCMNVSFSYNCACAAEVAPESDPSCPNLSWANIPHALDGISFAHVFENHTMKLLLLHVNGFCLDVADVNNRRSGQAPFDFPITSFFARDDKKIKESMVKGWANFTTQAFECNQIDGNHLYIMGINEQRDAKLKWYEIIVGQLKKLPHFN
mmetsp:Transcript_48891/g.93469  ORF Transcript_48891/g.93469 Transcript_48891/m.93469 type:complete len:164 (-) Transcript_48891:40-531(-)